MEQDNGRKDSLLPSDVTREVPTAALKWVLQFGLSYSYWKDLIAYSPLEERLYFLLRADSELVGSIGRYVGADEGKPKWRSRGYLHKHCEIVNPALGNALILVEDLVSAHKVGQVTTAIPLFGTVVHPVHYYYLRQETRPIYLWLDKDQEGRSIMHKAIGMQSVLGRPITTVTTQKDPKHLTLAEIKETLQ